MLGDVSAMSKSEALALFAKYDALRAKACTEPQVFARYEALDDVLLALLDELATAAKG